MIKNSLILPLFFTAILFSCKSSKEIKLKVTEINFTEIETGKNSNYTAFTTEEIHSIKELSAVWLNLFAKYDRKPPIPIIDFENKMLIAIALGKRNSGSYSIQVKSILETKNGININASENKPGASCNTSSVMVYPFQLIEIPRTAKKITCTKTVEVNECDKGF
jgi:hypothetical protein